MALRPRGGREMKSVALALGGGGGAGPRSHRRGRSAGRDGREAGGDRRYLDRRADRRGLCRRHERPRDAPSRDPHRAQPHRRDAPHDAGPRRQVARSVRRRPWRRDAAGRGARLRAVPAGESAGGFFRPVDPADRDRLGPLPSARGCFHAGAAAAGAGGVDLASDHHASSRDRRAGSGRRRRDPIRCRSIICAALPT